MNNRKNQHEKIDIVLFLPSSFTLISLMFKVMELEVIC